MLSSPSFGEGSALAKRRATDKSKNKRICPGSKQISRFSTPVSRPNRITELRNRTICNAINLMKQINWQSLCLLRVQPTI